MKLVSIFVAFLSIFCFAKAQTVPAYVPLSGLEAWYAFDSSAADSSGNGNNGTVYGATAVLDRFGHPYSAYYFNGISNSIIIPSSSSLNITSDITLSAWVKSDFIIGSQEIIYFRGDNRSAYDPYLIYITYDSVIFLRNTGAGYVFNQVAFPKSLIDTTSFHQIVGTLGEDDTMKIYLDDQLMKTAYRPGAISYYTDSAHNTVGACDYGTWQFFKGTIDDIGTWNRRLSDCEISKLYYAIPTFITANPLDFSVILGSPATFNITDTGGTATYQWQENSGTGFVNLIGSGFYSGVTTKTLTINPVAGDMCNYLYRCIRNSGTCVDTSLAGKLVCSSTGISNLSYGEESGYINVSPNPGDGRFIISGSMQAGNDGTITADFFDLIGQKIYSRILHPVKNSINEQFFLSKILPAGTYFLRLHSENEQKSVRIIVNKAG